MEFVLLGFDQSASARQFRFGSIKASRSHTSVVVVADLSLARKYNIQVQDLPLLCRELLDRSDAEALEAGVLTLTETHMAALSKAAREESEERQRRRSRHVVSGDVGKAWRTPAALTAAPKAP